MQTYLNRFMRTGYTLDIIRQTACLVLYPIMTESYAALFSCTAVVKASDSMTPRCEAFNSWLKLDDSLCLDPPLFNQWFSLALARSVGILSHEPSSLFHHSVLLDLSVSVMMH